MTVGNDFGDLLRHCPPRPNVALKPKLQISPNLGNGVSTLFCTVPRLHYLSTAEMPVPLVVLAAAQGRMSVPGINHYHIHLGVLRLYST